MIFNATTHDPLLCMGLRARTDQQDILADTPQHRSPTRFPDKSVDISPGHLSRLITAQITKFPDKPADRSPGHLSRQITAQINRRQVSRQNSGQITQTSPQTYHSTDHQTGFQTKQWTNHLDASADRSQLDHQKDF